MHSENTWKLKEPIPIVLVTVPCLLDTVFLLVARMGKQRVERRR